MPMPEKVRKAWENGGLDAVTSMRRKAGRTRSVNAALARQAAEIAAAEAEAVEEWCREKSMVEEARFSPALQRQDHLLPEEEQPVLF